MKNVYFVQANNIYGTDKKSTYIPYSIGCIQAYCMQDSVITKEYRFNRMIYTKLPVNDFLRFVEKPYIVLFSCSVWNFEYNKAIAAAVKKYYPDCIIVFGGHSVSMDGEHLEKYPFIDFLTHRFGEEPTLGILKCLATGESMYSVPNISFRDGNKIITTQSEPQINCDYPSPYLMGLFDDILEDDIEFSVLLETNRGCPNSCSFCDWGSLKSKVRLFPIERVKAEIDWFVKHKIEYVYCTDGNFCLFNRDIDIADYIIESKEKYGYPKAFRVCFTKNRIDFVYSVGKKLCKYGLNKAQTISFQSMNNEVLKNVGRKNIPTSQFRDLMKKYNEANLSTFSELILGLPGETYDSFCEGIATLIDNGQHYALNIYPCELIPNAEIAQKEYMEKYNIKSTKVPFKLIHSTPSNCSDEITEYSIYITSTYSMNVEEWIDSMIFAQYIQALHNLGLLRSIAIFFHYEYKTDYAAFYKNLIMFSANHSGSLLNKVYMKIKKLVNGIIAGSNELVAPCDNCGELLWGFDEIIFLEFYKELDKFYKEICDYCLTYKKDAELVQNLISYQKDVIKKILAADVTIESDYDFYHYFKLIYSNEYEPLVKAKTVLKIKDHTNVQRLAEFAKEIVWYGRNKRATDYTSGFYDLSCL